MPRPKKLMRQASTKQASRLRLYSELRQIYLADHPWCEVHLTGFFAKDGKPEYVGASDIHHKASRGIHLNDVRYFMAVSRKAHDYIHANGKEARSRGWILDL